jgi:hypothetical protein
MEIIFSKSELENLPVSLSREWIESSQFGSYASSTIVGMNTRRKHGLLVYQPKISITPLVVLSHLQEEIYIGQNQFPLHNVEYENHLSIEGLNFLESFQLDPFPTYIYKFGAIVLEKSLYFTKNSHRLLVSYRISNGEKIPEVRLVIRPFLAYRPVNDKTNPEIFENTEAFLDAHQLRFLPGQNSPELFMQYTRGEFFNSPTWYYDFKYRSDKTDPQDPEGLLSPGFLEIKFDHNNNVYMSFAMDTLTREDLAKLFAQEREKRLEPQKKLEKRSELVGYLQDRVNNFGKLNGQNREIFVTDLLDGQFHLSLHCLMLFRLVQSGIPRKEAEKYYDELLTILREKSLPDLFMGLHESIKVEAASLFFIVFFLYKYHLHYDRGEGIDKTLEILQEIISLIRKDHLPYYRMKRRNLLERQYRKSDLNSRSDYEVFFPTWQNFMLNVFWFNILKMAIHLGELRGIRMNKYQRWTKKIKNHFHIQYMKSFIANPINANTRYNFVFHPTMIFAITLPFSIIENREAQILYRVLIKQFLVKEGIRYPVRNKEDTSHLVSPILIADYFEGWRMLMKEKEFLGDFFQRVSLFFEDQLREGVLGYIPNFVAGPNSSLRLPYRASGVSSCEVMYFLYRQITL